ncbi:hypothetical protein DVH24_015849, partial [Malus domestica]
CTLDGGYEGLGVGSLVHHQRHQILTLDFWFLQSQPLHIGLENIFCDCHHCDLHVLPFSMMGFGILAAHSLLPYGDVYCSKEDTKLWALIMTIAAVAGSVGGVISDLKIYKPFKTSY